MDDTIANLINKYDLKSKNVAVADVAIALGTIMMSIDGYVDETEVCQAIKFGEMIFGNVDEDKLERYKDVANARTHRPEINLQVSKRLLETVDFELTNQDHLSIFAFLSAIAIADKTVTSEETDLLNLIFKEFELEDFPTASEIDEEIERYREKSTEYAWNQQATEENADENNVESRGSIEEITFHYSNLAKEFTSAVVRLRILGKIDATLHDALLNAWLISPIEIKVGLATAARSNPEHLLNWIKFSEEHGGPTAN